MPQPFVKKPVWKKAIQNCADPQRARHYLEQIGESALSPAPAEPSAEQARILAALFSGSPALAELLLAHPHWLKGLLDPESLRHPRREQGLRREVESWLKPLVAAGDFANACARLREFKQREMLRIGARDLSRLSHVPEITRELSSVADVCLDVVWRLCQLRLVGSFGQPYHLGANRNWEPTHSSVLALGKLGGQELNYSSDVDVIFIYSDEGNTFKTAPRDGSPAGRRLTNHDFYTRTAKEFIAEVTRQAPEGVLYRVDLRLRPEGNAGPLVRSLGSYENYYAQWGQTWERMMLIKARWVAGDAALAAEFLEMIQPFRYPRSMGGHIPGEIAAMKRRIETEVVKQGEADRNVKLGRGGIREIEFVVQTLQLLHAGRLPFLQDAQTLPALQKLARYRLLAEAEAQALAEAYCFLRDIEHRLQMEQNLQTHTIPTDGAARERLAVLMGFKAQADFETALRQHTTKVRQVYDALLKAEQPPAESALPGDLEDAGPQWQRLLADHSFREVDKAIRLATEFIHGPGFVHVSSRTVELARELFRRFLALCPKQHDSSSGANFPSPHDEGVGRGIGRGAGKFPSASTLVTPLPDPLPARASPREGVGEPDRGGARQQRSASPGRATDANLLPQLLSDPDRVLTRLDSFITAYGARQVLYETWSSQPSRFELMLQLFDCSEFLAETAIRTPDLVDTICQSGHLRRHKRADESLKELRHGAADIDQRLWLRRYHQAELMRIGLRDITGLIDFEAVLAELSALAEACLQYALESVQRKNKLDSAPFAVIALGKLGGRELTYGSDLDVFFVADARAQELHRLQRMAADVLALLSEPTDLGAGFKMDARLRPDGEKGLLVNTLDAYEEYYRQRARLWEIQTLTRIRPVAGDPDVGGRFQQLAARLTNFQRPSPPLAAWKDNWRKEIARMRTRIETERTPVGKQTLAIKTGAGGLMDAEFIAQAICLEHGWQEPNTLGALERASREKVLPAGAATRLIENYRQLLRIECILRRWSFEGEAVLPDDPAALYRVAMRCGWSNPEDFLQAIAKYRRAVREVYRKVFRAVSRKL